MNESSKNPPISYENYSSFVESLDLKAKFHFNLDMSYSSDLIFDVGMCEGDDTEYYLSKGFRVLAIEANPYLCLLNSVKFAEHIENGRLSIQNYGVSDEFERIPFYISPKSDWSSFNESYATRAGETEVIEVECVTLPWLFSKYGTPYYCKIDIEGYDAKVLRTLQNSKSLPKFVSVEATVGSFSSILEPLGYRNFKLVNQVFISTIPPQDPPLEGNISDVKIIPGKHSGQFGEETYGKWLNKEVFDAEYRKLLTRDWEGSLQKLYGVPMEMFHRWHDFHAKLD